MSCNGNVLWVTGLLCGESNGFPIQMASYLEGIFSDVSLNKLLNSQVARDLGHHDTYVTPL